MIKVRSFPISIAEWLVGCDCLLWSLAQNSQQNLVEFSLCLLLQYRGYPNCCRHILTLGIQVTALDGLSCHGTQFRLSGGVLTVIENLSKKDSSSSADSRVPESTWSHASCTSYEYWRGYWGPSRHWHRRLVFQDKFLSVKVHLTKSCPKFACSVLLLFWSVYSRAAPWPTLIFLICIIVET